MNLPGGPCKISVAGLSICRRRLSDLIKEDKKGNIKGQFVCDYNARRRDYGKSFEKLQAGTCSTLARYPER